jgi:SAM-dependent methyltransferase
MELQANDLLARYRTQFMCDVLRRISRTHFESVVDLGCGDGSILRAMLQRVGAHRGRGIDLSVADVSSDSLTLCRGNILEYVPEEQYQLVVSNQVFEHIYEPWLPKYFQVLKASCAPDGVILMSTPNRWRPKNIVRMLTLRRPYLMSPNKGVPQEQHLGHHRECSYRELQGLLCRYFQEPEWKIRIERTVPRQIESRARGVVNLLVYFLFWLIWRPLFVSASQDHYVVIQRTRLDSLL